MLKLLTRLHVEDEGQDIIEYALLAAFISILAIAVVKGVGTAVNTIFSNVNTALQ